MHRKFLATTLVAAAALAALPAAAPAATKRAPKVDQLVVFRSGATVQKAVRASATTAKVGRRRCAVARGTALGALIRSRIGKVGLRNYGACTKRTADGGGLFVRSIRSDRNRGKDGWVYKVGRRLATAGAADPSGAFGSGRLRSGSRVTWFYCVLTGRSCQRTLALTTRPDGGGILNVRVRAYDDEGRGTNAAAAVVTAGGVKAITGADGVARISLPRGRVKVYAAGGGAIRSFTEKATVR